MMDQTAPGTRRRRDHHDRRRRPALHWSTHAQRRGLQRSTRREHRVRSPGARRPVLRRTSRSRLSLPSADINDLLWCSRTRSWSAKSIRNIIAHAPRSVQLRQVPTARLGDHQPMRRRSSCPRCPTTTEIKVPYARRARRRSSNMPRPACSCHARPDDVADRRHDWTAQRRAAGPALARRRLDGPTDPRPPELGARRVRHPEVQTLDPLRCRWPTEVGRASSRSTSRARAWQDDGDLVFAHPVTGKPLYKAGAPLGAPACASRSKQQGLTRPHRFHDLQAQLRNPRWPPPGVPMLTIQKWMGHRDIKTTQRYSDYAPSPREAKHGRRRVRSSWCHSWCQLERTSQKLRARKPNEYGGQHVTADRRSGSNPGAPIKRNRPRFGAVSLFQGPGAGTICSRSR